MTEHLRHTKTEETIHTNTPNLSFNSFTVAFLHLFWWVDAHSAHENVRDFFSQQLSV